MKKPIVIAYSGGFRSSVAIAWLADKHAADVVTVTLGLGQSTGLLETRDRALASGAARAHVIDARDEFVRDYVWPSLRADALSDARYVMATALSRPAIVKQLVAIARIEGTAVVAHAAAGRDGARMQQTIRSLDSGLKSIACAETMTAAMVTEYADRLGRAVPPTGADRVDDNLWARTVGRPADESTLEVPDAAFTISRDLSQAPATPAVVELTFDRGTPVGINGVTMTPVELIESLTTIAGEHGVGRADRVKNRAGRPRSRVLYEAPAAAVLHHARRELDRLSSPENLNRFTPAVSAAYADALARGEWFSRLREGLDAFVTSTQQEVSGTVRVKLFKGQTLTVSRTLNS